MVKKRTSGVDAELPESAKPHEHMEALHVPAPASQNPTPDEIASLRAQLDAARAELAVERAKRTDAEQKAYDAAANQSLMMQSTIEEVPTGRTVKIRMVKRYKETGVTPNGRPILRPVWTKREVPTFFYKLDLPPIGGSGLTINGVMLNHGDTHEVDLYSLRSLKEMVYRLWDHENSVFGRKKEDELFRKQNTRIGLRGGKVVTLQ